ncbi:uncharacterized protein LOC143628577 [Bidens hawaiensis]|uniref:uncharacterized protein LOC143628577 n=1 Tax=Bidens hawaiensis TaxID=980011 RepID=UPI00404B34B1
MINVYAPQTNGGKRDLWAKIDKVLQEGHGWWIVLGDFNAVRESNERKNSYFDHVCARDFNDFLDNTGLHEYSLKGSKFTYLVNRQGVCKMSRIDRIFVCDGIFNKRPSSCVRTLRKVHSDHAPLVLTLIDTNFGPKPFRWFDSWLDRTGCEELVKSVLLDWSDMDPPDVNLIKKVRKASD